MLPRTVLALALAPAFALAVALCGCHAAVTYSDAAYDEDGERYVTDSRYGLDFVTTSDGGGFEWGVNRGKEPAILPNSSGELDRTQVYGGLRWSWEEGPWHPYAGAGIEWNRVELEIERAGSPASEVDREPAGYVHVGLLFDLDREWFLGVDARIGGLGAEHDFEDLGLQRDADDRRVSWMLGFRF